MEEAKRAEVAESPTLSGRLREKDAEGDGVGFSGRLAQEVA